MTRGLRNYGSRTFKYAIIDSDYFLGKREGAMTYSFKHVFSVTKFITIFAKSNIILIFLMFDIPLRTITHYGLHFVAPILLALLFFRKERRVKAFLIMIATMAVDADHLLADPIFDPNRMSIGFHPLHSYIAIAIYVIMCFIPYERLNLPWWLRAVGIGLVFHMITDWQDFVLWL